MQRKTFELTQLGEESVISSTVASDPHLLDKCRKDALKDYLTLSQNQRNSVKRLANTYVLTSYECNWKTNWSRSQVVAVDDILSNLKTRHRSKSLTRKINYKIGTLVNLISASPTRVDTSINVSAIPHKKSPKHMFFKHQHLSPPRTEFKDLKITSYCDRSRSTSPLKRLNRLHK
jgi:hypothetical protein